MSEAEPESPESLESELPDSEEDWSGRTAPADESTADSDSRPTAHRDALDINAQTTGDIRTGHSLIINMGDSSSEDQEAKPVEAEPEDPTIPLDLLMPRPLPLATELVDEWYGRLGEGNLLILGCFDDQALRSAGQLVADRFGGARRYLNLDGKEIESYDPTLDSLLHEKLPWPPHTLVVAAATTLAAQKYIDAIAKGWTTSLAAQQRLRQQERRLLLLTTPDLVPPSEALPYAAVPFLEPHLRAKFPAEKAQEWAQEIERQRLAGNWEGREKRFWELFDASLKSDLEKAIQRRVWTGRAEGTTRGQRVGTDGELANTALFLAALFPTLPVEDYDDLLRRLLHGRVRRRKIDTFVLTENGEGLPCEIEEEQSLVELWDKSYERVFERCKLVVLPPTPAVSGSPLRSGPRGPIVDFELPELRDQVQAEFLGVHYLLLIRLFIRVRELRLLYDPSPSIMEGTLHLMQTMASVDTDRYGSDMLQELLDQGAAKHRASSTEADTDKRATGADRSLLFSRLYLLIRTFLKEPGLREAVHRFLNELIGKGRHVDALELVKRLRFAAEFDQVFWWKQLLERGAHEAKDRTYKEMSSALRMGGSQFPETLRKVGRWVEDGEATRSKSTEWANQLLYEQLDQSLHRSRFRRIGVWPPKDPVQVALCDLRLGDSDLRVIDWLFHPGFTDYLQQERGLQQGSEKKSTLRTGPGHYPTLIVWRWILNPVEQSLEVEPKDLADAWKKELVNLPKQLSGLGQPVPMPRSFQTLVLADLALSLHGAHRAEGETEPPDEPLAEVLAATATVVPEPEHCRLLEAYWNAMSHFVEQLLTYPPAERATADDFEQARSRLAAQYQSLGTLQQLFRQAVKNASVADLQGDSSCNP